MKIRPVQETDVGAFARGMKVVTDEGFLGPDENATVADIEALVEIGIKDPDRAYLLAEEEGNLVGAILVYPDPDLGATSFGVWVLPNHRGDGVGRALVEAGLAGVPKESSEIRIEVWPDNEPAIGLFEELGFGEKEVTGEEHPRVGGTDSQILRMRLALGQGGAEVSERA